MLEDLRARLDLVEPGVDVLPALVEALREALRAERSLAYGVDIGPERYQLSFLNHSGFSLEPRVAHATLDGFVGARRDPWGYFNPANPQPSQRNRELHFHAPGMEAPAPAPPRDDRFTLWKTLGVPMEEQARLQAHVRASVGGFLQEYGLARMMFLRVLVCEGPALLGWVGAMRSEPFNPRELNLLRELIPSLQRRLALDARLREGGMLHAALEAALEALGQAAYVVTSTGRVAFANSLGRARLEQDSGLVAEALKRHLKG